MAERLGEAYLELTVRQQKLQAGLLEAQKRSITFTEKVGAQFKSLGSSMAAQVAKGFAAFAAGQKILSEIRAGIDRAMKLEDLTVAFENLAGGTKQAAMMQEELNRAFKGTIEQSKMLEQANNAMLLGVAKNSKEMAFLAMAGRRLAKAVGKDAAYGFESLVTGIGRQSRMMLDNLGIVVKTEVAYAAYAAELGKTAAELTDAEKKQAFMNATMDATREKLSRLGIDTETLNEKWAKFKTTWANIFTAVGSGIASVAETFHDLVRDVSRGIRDVFSPGATAAIRAAQEAIIEQESQQIKNEQELAAIIAERAKQAAKIKRFKEEEYELSIKLRDENYKTWQDSIKRTESLEVARLRALGKEHEATKLQIELDKKRMLEKAESLDEELKIHELTRARMVQLDKKMRDEEVRAAEEAARKREQIAAEETRQVLEHRRRIQETIRQEENMKRQVQAWETKNANLTIRYLRLIEKHREADIRQLEEWRKSEIEAANGSAERLRLIDAVYKAELNRIQKINQEISRPQWMGAEELWKRSVALSKGAEPARTDVHVTAQASTEDKMILKENQEQTKQLKELNDKASFVPRFV